MVVGEMHTVTLTIGISIDWLIDWYAEMDVYWSGVNKLMHVRAVNCETDWSLWFHSLQKPLLGIS